MDQSECTEDRNETQRSSRNQVSSSGHIHSDEIANIPGQHLNDPATTPVHNAVPVPVQQYGELPPAQPAPQYTAPLYVGNPYQNPTIAWENQGQQHYFQPINYYQYPMHLMHNQPGFYHPSAPQFRGLQEQDASPIRYAQHIQSHTGMVASPGFYTHSRFAQPLPIPTAVRPPIVTEERAQYSQMQHIYAPQEQFAVRPLVSQNQQPSDTSQVPKVKSVELGQYLNRPEDAQPTTSKHFYKQMVAGQENLQANDRESPPPPYTTLPQNQKLFPSQSTMETVPLSSTRPYCIGYTVDLQDQQAAFEKLSSSTNPQHNTQFHNIVKEPLSRALHDTESHTTGLEQFGDANLSENFQTPSFYLTAESEEIETGASSYPSDDFRCSGNNQSSNRSPSTETGKNGDEDTAAEVVLKSSSYREDKPLVLDNFSHANQNREGTCLPASSSARGSNRNKDTSDEGEGDMVDKTAALCLPELSARRQDQKEKNGLTRQSPKPSTLLNVECTTNTQNMHQNQYTDDDARNNVTPADHVAKTAALADLFVHLLGNHDANKPSNLSEDNCLWIQNLLIDAAKSQCKSKSFQALTRQQIEICPLELTDKPSRKISSAEYKNKPIVEYSDEDGHYNRRKDYESIDFKQDSKVTVEQLFAKAVELANDLGQPQFANSVALIGQPGIGKTTLSKVITEMAIFGQTEGINKMKWVFYISLKTIDFQNETTLVDFLCKASLSTNAYNKLLAKRISMDALGSMILELQDVLICMDGLDEASADWKLSYRKCDYSKKNNPLCYLYGLMMGEILPDAKKVFTSRQGHFFTIKADYRPLFVAEVMGLNTTSQEDLCKQICKDKGAKVWSVIESNPNLSYSCYVPAKCIFIAFVIFESLKAGSDGLFYSLTHVFALGFSYYFRQGLVRGEADDDESKKFLNKIAKLAWNGFHKQKIVFGNKDLLEVEIEPKLLTNILATFVTEENWNIKFMDSDIRRYFSHLIWQEYFASCYLVFFLTVEDFSKLLSELKDNRWEVVSKFVFGLCNDEVVDVANACFSDTVYYDVAKKKHLLRDYLISELKKCQNEEENVLQICSWLQEIDDEGFYVDIVHLLPETLTLTGSVLLTDVYSVDRVLSKSDKSYNFKVTKICKFHHGSFDVLLTSIGKQIKDITIYNTAFGQEIKDLSKHSSSIKGKLDVCTIEMGKDYLEPYQSETFIKRFAKYFQPATKIPLLSLRGFEFDDQTVSAVSSCVNTADSFTVSCCKVSGSVFQNIALAMTRLQHPPSTLCFDDTWIDDEGASAIASCVPMVKNLSLSACNISGPGMCKIATSLLQLQHHMESLDVSGNCLSKSVVKMLLDHRVVAHVNNLYVSKYTVSEKGIEETGKFNLSSTVSEGQLSHEASLELFTKSAFLINSIPSKIVVKGDLQAGCLSFIMHLFPPELELIVRNVSNFALQELTQSINKKIAVFDLEHWLLDKERSFHENSVDDESASAIASCIQWFDSVSLAKCNMTSAGISVIATSISLLLEPIPSFKLEEFDFDDESASAIASCLNMIKSLSLPECKFNKSAFQIIGSAITLLQQPLTTLDISNTHIDNDDASSIASCLHMIKNLSLSGCGISIVGMSKIATSLLKLQTEMELLDVSGNRISKSVIEILMDRKVFSNIRNLYVTTFEVSDKEIKETGKLNLTTSITTSDLSLDDPVELFVKSAFKVALTEKRLVVDGDFEAYVLSCVMHLLSSIQEIKMKTIGGFAMQEVANSINTRIPLLDLSNNRISDESASAIASCIQWIDCLNVQWCEMTSVGFSTITTSISQLQQPMKKVILAFTKIGNSGAASLAGCIQFIEDVVLVGCDIEGRGIEVLTVNIKELRKPMKSLCLSSNMVRDCGAALLANCIENIEELDLYVCGIEDRGVQILCEKIKDLEKPMKYLDLSNNTCSSEKSAESLASCVHNIDKLKATSCGFTQAGKDLIKLKSRGEVGL